MNTTNAKVVETPCRITEKDFVDSPSMSAQNSPRYIRHSSEEDRNPEPPAELTAHPELIVADTIGNTVFSRQWLFSTLSALIKVVEGKPLPSNGKNQDGDEADGGEAAQPTGENSKGAPQSSTGECSTEGTGDFLQECGDDAKKGSPNEESHGNAGASEDSGEVDIDENLQDELCKLWDMSMNTEVVKFLEEFKAVELLTGVIEKSKAPRATEICVGILGNMACHKSVAREMAHNEAVINIILLLLRDADAPTLIETTRLIHVCVSASDTDNVTPWMQAVADTNLSVFDSLVFILNSSTNSELLCNCCLLVDKLMDLDDSLCSDWSREDMILALVESVKQCGYKASEPIETVLHTIQLMSTNDRGVQAIVSVSHVLHDLVLLQYLFHQCSQFEVDIIDKENSLASAASILHVILNNCRDSHRLFFKDFQLIRCSLKLLEAVYPQVQGHRSCDRSKHRRRSHHRRSENQVGGQKLGNSSFSVDVDLDKSQTEASVTDKVAPVTGSPTAAPASTSTEKAGTTNTDATAAQEKASCSSSIRGPRSRQSYSAQVGGHSANGNQSESVRLLFTTLQQLLVDIISFTEQASGSEAGDMTPRHDPKEVSDEGDDGTPAVWEYLDQSCTRSRLCYMLWTLEQSRRKPDVKSNDSEAKSKSGTKTKDSDSVVEQGNYGSLIADSDTGNESTGGTSDDGLQHDSQQQTTQKGSSSNWYTRFKNIADEYRLHRLKSLIKELHKTI